MVKCGLSFKNESAILKEEVLVFLQMFERSKLNVLLRVLHTNVVFNRSVNHTKVVKGN